MSTKFPENEPNRMRLAEIRSQLKYSMSEMAEELVISKSTYQGYETGRRHVPALTLSMAFDALQRVKAFDKRYQPGGEFDKYIREIPMFMSEAIRE